MQGALLRTKVAGPSILKEASEMKSWKTTPVVPPSIRLSEWIISLDVGESHAAREVRLLTVLTPLPDVHRVRPPAHLARKRTPASTFSQTVKYDSVLLSNIFRVRLDNLRANVDHAFVNLLISCISAVFHNWTNRLKSVDNRLSFPSFHTQNTGYLHMIRSLSSTEFQAQCMVSSQITTDSPFQNIFIRRNCKRIIFSLNVDVGSQNL